MLLRGVFLQLRYLQFNIYTVKPPKTIPWTYIFQKRVKKEILKCDADISGWMDIFNLFLLPLYCFPKSRQKVFN